ncbi:MAG: peptidylprolyl isomerase, partial [Alphaproteobacteria bacterium]|nr:peptidylprolyl isomerase [Alphaproteobacteria bacterium]
TIAATVNNKAISGQDLNNRIKLALISSGMPDTDETRRQLHEQILNMMINEQIQLQLGAEYKIKIDEATLMASIRDIEHQNNMPEGGLKKMLLTHGIPFVLMKQHLEASIIWREYIRERYRHLVQVSEAEVDHALRELASANKETRYHLAESVLYFDDKQGIGSVKAQANRIVGQLNQGAKFSMLAGQFSNAPSAARGGDIGWIPESKLDENALPYLKALESGQISVPIQTGKGFRIYFVRDKLSAGQFAKPVTT